MKLEKLILLIKENKFKLVILLILVIALSIRLYNFPNPWGFGNDDSRDVAIAREALSRGSVPLIGSFSSAGPFVIGPIFYWFLMASYLFSSSLFTPWLTLAFLGVLTVVAYSYLGYLLGGRKLAIVMAIIAATSPQLFLHSQLLSNPSLVGLFSALSLLFFIKLWQEKKELFSFLTGLSVGLAIGVHYSALNLLVFAPFVLLVKVPSRSRLVFLTLFLVGVLLPALPLLFWDSHQNFANVRNVAKYFLIDQYRLYVPNSWKLFLFNYFPSSWAFVAGYKKELGFTLMLFSAVVSVFSFYKKRLNPVLLPLGIMFAILFILNRFYHGERSESYLIYFSPFIILFTSWSLTQLENLTSHTLLKNILIFIPVLLITLLNFSYIASTLNTRNNLSFYENFIAQIASSHRGQKFTVFDYQGKMSNYSQPLGLLLTEKGLYDKNGLQMGLSCLKDCPANLPLFAKMGSIPVYDLSRTTGVRSKSSKWSDSSRAGMYDNLIGWSEKHELSSDFNLMSIFSR